MLKHAVSILLLSNSVLLPGQSDFYKSLADSALVLTLDTVVYDPGYFAIDYPNGDIPSGRGVCTDVIIRAYRMLGIDLQSRVHEDMREHFNKYPDNWGLSGPDRNIDHRRVPNLMVYFSRHGEQLAISGDPAAYLPGDIVCWDLGGGITHIGIVSDINSGEGRQNLIVHNIGNGQVLEDCLFDFKIIGHYRYGK
jgi:uncharacterized protein YijF (DUF1287 family)